MSLPLLPIAVARAIRASGLRPTRWATDVADLPPPTFRELMKNGTCNGRTLAKLQKAGVRVANRDLIESLDRPPKRAA